MYRRISTTFLDSLLAKRDEIEMEWRLECAKSSPDIRRVTLARSKLYQYQSTIGFFEKMLDTDLREAV